MKQKATTTQKITELVRDTGEARGFLLRTMAEIKSGECSTAKGVAIATVMREVNSTMQIEVNKLKVLIGLPEQYKHLIQDAALGKGLLGNDGPVYDGRGSHA